ncbi:MAG: MaoC family dehydratase [Nitrospinota bacterium]|nr:MaoC family dehydratase [Nitrospinota bacterium]
MGVRFFEDFEVGQTFTAGGIELTQDEIMEFARNYDPQPFHVDIDYAEKFQYGGIIASGFHTMAVTMRLFVDTGFLGTSSLGSPGIESIKWPNPVRPGDVLSLSVSLVSKRVSKSDPSRGVMILDYTTTNQEEEVKLKMTGAVLMKCSPS